MKLREACLETIPQYSVPGTTSCKPLSNRQNQAVAERRASFVDNEKLKSQFTSERSRIRVYVGEKVPSVALFVSSQRYSSMPGHRQRGGWCSSLAATGTVLGGAGAAAYLRPHLLPATSRRST